MGRRGVVLSWQQGQAQVLDNQGAFVTIRSKHPLTVGECISIPAKSRQWTKVVLAACVLLLFSGGFVFDGMALAHVSLDMKQSVELGVNWRDKVVSARAVNSETQGDLPIGELTGRPLSEAVATIVSEALKSTPEGTLPMAVVTVSGKVNTDKLREQAEQAVQTAMAKGKKTGHVVGISVTREIRAEAKEAGVSPGQYALALKATEQGKEVTVQSIKDKGLEQALESAGADPKTVAESAKAKGAGQVKQEVKDKVQGKPENTPSTEKNEKDKGKNSAPGQQKKPK